MQWYQNRGAGVEQKRGWGVRYGRDEVRGFSKQFVGEIGYTYTGTGHIAGKVPPWGVSGAPDTIGLMHWGRGEGCKARGGGGVPLRWGQCPIPARRLFNYKHLRADMSQIALVEKRAE